MNYRKNPSSIRALVEPDRVHRDVYLDPELFELERERVFARSWVFVGHDSQVPASGDYLTTSIAGTPIIMVRAQDRCVHVLENRCAHKGSMLVSRASGSVGKFFRCPYHAWSYKLDGTPIAVPLKDGYAGTSLSDGSSGQGLAAVVSRTYCGFVFARLAADGPSFEEHFGAITAVLDNLAERSPLAMSKPATRCSKPSPARRCTHSYPPQAP